MLRLPLGALIFAGLMSTIGPAQACFMAASLELSDVMLADAVVIGEITDYQIIEDQLQRERRQSYLDSLTPEQREVHVEHSSFISDYARFNIEVSTVLRGDVEGVIGATWDNSTYGEPASLPTGPYLIALRRAGTPLPPLRGPSATILPDPEPGLWSILQAPCAPPFLFESTGATASAIQVILSVEKQ